MARRTRIVAWIYLLWNALMSAVTFGIFFVGSMPDQTSTIIIAIVAAVLTALYLSLLLNRRWAWQCLMVANLCGVVYGLFTVRRSDEFFGLLVMFLLPGVNLALDWEWGMAKKTLAVPHDLPDGLAPPPWKTSESSVLPDVETNYEPAPVSSSPTTAPRMPSGSSAVLEEDTDHGPAPAYDALRISRGTRVVAWIYLILNGWWMCQACFSAAKDPSDRVISIASIATALVAMALYSSLLLSRRWAWRWLMVTNALVIALVLLLGRKDLKVILDLAVVWLLPCIALAFDWRWGMGEELLDTGTRPDNGPRRLKGATRREKLVVALADLASLQPDYPEISRGTRIVARIYLVIYGLWLLGHLDYLSTHTEPVPGWHERDFFIVPAAVWTVLYCALTLNKRWAWWGLMASYSLVLIGIGLMLPRDGAVALVLLWPFLWLCLIPCIALAADWRWSMGKKEADMAADLALLRGEDGASDSDTRRIP